MVGENEGILVIDERSIFQQMRISFHEGLMVVVEVVVVSMPKSSGYAEVSNNTILIAVQNYYFFCTLGKS